MLAKKMHELAKSFKAELPEDLLKHIEYAAKNGNFSVRWGGKLSIHVHKELEKQGFVVKQHADIRDPTDGGYTISW